MKLNPARSKMGSLGYMTLALLLIFVLSLTGCGQPTASSLAVAGTVTIAPPDVTPTAADTATSAPPVATHTAYATAMLTAEIGGDIGSAFSTAEAAEARGALTTVPLQQTALARPTLTLYTFPTPARTSAPQPTPIVGQQPPEHCVPQIHGFSETNCWIVLLNNEYVYVDGGNMYNIQSGNLSDDTIGAIVVFTSSLTLGGLGPTEFYPTPQRLGPVHIVAVAGSRVTLLLDNAQATPVAFVFDLSTRQWVCP